MLSELTITNFAIIEKQSLSFHPRFNVISGETGAGKSILLHALEFILGGKGSASLVRSGADLMEVQALFDLAEISTDIRAELPEIVGDGDELVVSRTQPREGRGKVLINGRLGTVALLEEIVRKLVNICSQHHQTKLLDGRYHVELLDGFASLESQSVAMSAAYAEWQKAKRHVASLEEHAAKREERSRELDAIVEDLEELVELREGRRTELETEIRRIANAEKLISVSQRAIELCSGDSGLSGLIRELHHAVGEIARLDASAEGIVRDFEQSIDGLAECEIALGRYVNGLDVDAAALELMREELSELARLERKYRTDDKGLAELLRSARQERSQYDHEQGLRNARQTVESLAKEVQRLGEVVRLQRQKAAKKLTAAVNKELSELAMPDATLSVRFTPTEPTARGLDAIDFLISTNKGEPHAALSKMASGGELSRVMLVLKKILREQSGVNVLIFDEVDTGISGGVARSVGRMLKSISEQSQVLCITHLPQVASLSDKHFLVQKEVGERALTVVRSLTDTEKVDEIARMLAGFTITDASRASARELIESS
jgi:DNA repair protein RecN (Recombination protein N)